MVMDLVRSCYVTDCYFFRDDFGVAVPIKWRRALPGARMFPRPHAFFSRNWDDKWSPFDGVGEVWGVRRPWSNGASDPLGTGQFFCGLAEDFERGASYDAGTDLARTPDGLLLCCLHRRGLIGVGALRAGGRFIPALAPKGHIGAGLLIGGHFTAHLATGYIAGGILAGGRQTPAISPAPMAGGLLAGGRLTPSISLRAIAGGVVAGNAFSWVVALQPRGGLLAGGTFTIQLELIFDSFTAADGTLINGRTPDVGSTTWSKTAGTPQIQSGQYVKGDAVINAGTDQVTIEADLTGSAVGGGAFGIGGRMTSAGSSYGFYLEPASGDISIWLNDATKLAHVAAGIAAGTAYHCVAVLSGHALSWSANGHTVTVGGASGHDGVSTHGLIMNTATAWSADNFKISTP
jgi:hypothetical protein